MLLQWGRRVSAAESAGASRDTRARRTSFNGAAAFQRRKGRPCIYSNLTCLLASMGPPRFSGGKAECTHPLDRSLTWLQWGRRVSAAERRG